MVASLYWIFIVGRFWELESRRKKRVKIATTQMGLRICAVWSYFSGLPHLSAYSKDLPWRTWSDESNVEADLIMSSLSIHFYAIFSRHNYMSTFSWQFTEKVIIRGTDACSEEVSLPLPFLHPFPMEIKLFLWANSTTTCFCTIWVRMQLTELPSTIIMMIALMVGINPVWVILLIFSFIIGDKPDFVSPLVLSN